MVITYSQNNVTLDVYNSDGKKETKTITGVTMDPITQLTAALPKEGATITNLSTYQVEAMTWKSHEDVAGDANKDEWYILPSSNADNKGLAIVLGEPNDNKMGWAKDNENATSITTDLGTADNSTWKFVRVTDFDAHINELLAIYNFEDCVIYDRELAQLMKLIMKNKELIEKEKNGEGEEALFNEVYYAFLNYTGRMPEELKAPKAGSLYTIRPVADEETENALLVYVDKGDGPYATKEVYKDDVVRDDKSYDSRAAWMFEGTANGDYLALDGLTVKNIHTQCYLTALGADASAVNEMDAAKITLARLGACTTKFQVGSSHMAMSGAKVVNTGAADTKWIVEEIKEPATSVYYETEVTDGYSTLMLGFNSTIPAGVEAYYGHADGPILEDRYLSMTSYKGGVLPAMSPVVLKNTESEATVNAKFYYTATAAEKKDDKYMRGSLYFEAVKTAAIEEEDAYNGYNVNIYMLLTTAIGPTMVWVWEEFDENGNLTNAGSDGGGHVICKANKAYIVLRGDEAANASSLLFNFRPGTTGIVPVGVRGAETSTVNAIYDLQGRKLSEITQPGIYIVNGKKVMVK